MTKLYASSNFHIEELVSPYYIETFGPEKMKRILARYNPFMVKGLETLRAFLSDESITINDYLWNGVYTNSGLRHPSTSVGAELSGHKFMLCTDNKYKTSDPKDVQEAIMDNQHIHPFIRSMEDYRDTRSSMGQLGRHWHHIQWGYRLPDEDIDIFRP